VICALARVALGQAVLQSCAVITTDSVAALAWLPNPDANDIGSTLLKYLRLIVGTEMMGLESVVDDMVIHLFAALGFNAGRLLILSVHTAIWAIACGAIPQRVHVRRRWALMFVRLVACARHALCRSKNTLKFTMNKATCQATADVTVYDVSSKFRLAVVKVSEQLRCAALHCIARTARI
jgi:hypothetical protein